MISIRNESVIVLLFLLDCSALELAFSQHTLWLLTSCGEIQCRENISIRSPIGIRSTTLPGRFLSLCGKF